MQPGDYRIPIEFVHRQTWNPLLADLTDVLFFLPEVSNTRNFITDVGLDELELAEERCCYRTPESGCCEEFAELAGMIMEENNLQFPRTAEDAVTLYVNLLEEIGNI